MRDFPCTCYHDGKYNMWLKTLIGVTIDSNHWISLIKKKTDFLFSFRNLFFPKGKSFSLFCVVFYITKKTYSLSKLISFLHKFPIRNAHDHVFLQPKMLLWISKMQFWQPCRKYENILLKIRSFLLKIRKKIMNLEFFHFFLPTCSSGQVEFSFDNPAENFSFKVHFLSNFWYFLDFFLPQRNLKNELNLANLTKRIILEVVHFHK